jgi:hypothetical protein
VVRETFASAWWAAREPRILAISAAGTVASGVMLDALGALGSWSALSSTAISGIALVLLARSWLGLAIAATALGVLRRDRTAPVLTTMPVLQTVVALCLAILPLAPLMVGGFLMIPGRAIFTLIGTLLTLAGAYWVVMWSQAGMLLVDNRAVYFGAADASSLLTRGYRAEILTVWLIAGVGVVVAAKLELWGTRFLGAYAFGPPLAAIVSLVLRIIADAFATCCYAALYYELDKAEAAD